MDETRKLREPGWLAAFARDVHSQTGEDGVIEKILSLLPQRDKWCVEFGAWDGLHLSNSRNLIENAGYSAVLIEGSAARFEDLKRNYAGRTNVVPLNALVGWTAADGLDALLSKTAIPREFDFLSIDVDGNDYHIWKAVQNYRPKALCVEFNPTIPTEVSFVQPADGAVNQGNSLRALAELGREKNYELVSVVASNAFFVDRKYFPLFEIADNRPETLRTDVSMVTWLFSGYDGTVFLRGDQNLPWHGLRIKEKRVQVLPGFLRKYPGNYGPLGKLAYWAWVGASAPAEGVRRAWRKLAK